tara:strand:- start:16 stop:243 length:228 start_codon:yes stop_codon:yes gene_type:complete
MNEDELKQEINILFRKLKYPYDKMDLCIIKSWEEEYDTILDPTNTAQFFIDRYDKPLLYLQNFHSNTKITLNNSF